MIRDHRAEEALHELKDESPAALDDDAGEVLDLDEDALDRPGRGDDADLDEEVADLVPRALRLDLELLRVDVAQLEEQEVEEGVAGEGHERLVLRRVRVVRLDDGEDGRRLLGVVEDVEGARAAGQGRRGVVGLAVDEELAGGGGAEVADALLEDFDDLGRGLVGGQRVHLEDNNAHNHESVGRGSGGGVLFLVKYYFLCREIGRVSTV